MDALKKAEQDKKKAAEDLKANLAAGGVAEAGTHDEPGLEFPVARADAEPAGDTSQSERIPAGEAPDLTLVGDPMDLSLDSSLRLSGSSPSISGSVPPPGSDKEATLPSRRAINASLKDYFDSSQSLDRSRPEPGLSTSGSFRTGDTIARVSADTVFTATRRTPITGRVGLGLGVILVLSAALGALWFWGQIEQGSAGPADINPPQTAMSASGPEQQAPPAAAVSIPTGVSDSANDTPPISSTPTEEPSGGLAEPAQERGPPGPQEAPAGSKALLARSAKAPPEQQPEPPPIRAGLPASVAGMVAESSAIKITKSRRRDLVDPDITDAYRAYRRGDYRRAERIYRTVLSRQPDQRDALLGIAAVAARHGQTEQAQRYYGRLLQINPRDSVAHAALSGMQGAAGRDLSESKLKLLLDETPQAGQIHFSLGNLYARQGRWAEAQEAYFKAFGAESQNPDYVFNLAVSLDRMGQAKTAVGYYRQALVLADSRSVNFNTSQVLSRIQTLSHPPSSD
ncbi:MAG: tetratricopeptide repeat protein, partial [Chromatiales bacterium]